MAEEIETVVWPDTSAFGISTEGAMLVRWLKKDGDTVTAGQAVARVETRDGWVEMTTTLPGVLRHVVGVGTAIFVGDTIGHVEADPTVWPPAPRKSL